jgi:hypothetical protein
MNNIYTSLLIFIILFSPDVSFSREGMVNILFNEDKFDKSGIIKNIYEKRMMKKNNDSDLKLSDPGRKHKFNFYEDVLYSIYSLDNKHDFIFIYVDIPDMCGSVGCLVDVFKYKNNTLSKVLETSLIVGRLNSNSGYKNPSNLYIINKMDYGHHRLMQDDTEDGHIYYCWKNGQYEMDDSKVDEAPGWVSPCPGK